MNGINSLEVKKIDDLKLIRKILHSLQRPDYNLVTTILYEKELTTMTPNEVLNKVTAHELRNDIKPRAPPSSPTHSTLTSKQKRLLKKMAIKQSSSEEEESQCSSSDEDVMTPKLYKQVKILNKSLKKINLMGHMVFLQDGPHHQHMKVERKFKKNKEKKEKKPKHESFAIFGEWVSGGEESSISSSDESNKKFTTRTNMGSSSNTCLMAQGMESDVSDDDSDSPSYEELLELVHEHQKVIKKQSNEIENLNALNDLNAIFTINYENLLCKFKLLSEEHERSS